MTAHLGLGSFFAQLRLSLITAMQYRANFLLTVVSVVVGCIVEIALWRLVLKDTGHIQGFGLHELVVYIVLANVINMVCVNWESAIDLGSEIRTGAISRHLLRPISLFSIATAEWLAHKIPVMLGALPAFIGLHHFMPAFFAPGAANLAMFAALLALSLWLSAEIYFLLVLAAFWVSDSEGVTVAFNIFRWGFAGQAFPLSFYPSWVMGLLDATPMPYFVYYPTLALMGRMTSELFVAKLALGTLMALALTILRRLVWHSAQRRMQTVGG